MAEWEVKLTANAVDTEITCEGETPPIMAMDFLHILSGNYWGFSCEYGSPNEFLTGYVAGIANGSYCRISFYEEDTEPERLYCSFGRGDHITITGLLQLDAEIIDPLPLRVWHDLMPQAGQGIQGGKIISNWEKDFLSGWSGSEASWKYQILMTRGAVSNGVVLRFQKKDAAYPDIKIEAGSTGEAIGKLLACLAEDY